jgi:Ca-activated chloride channel family protein
MLIVLLIFASLARPQWGANWEKAETKGIDIMIALDTSRSMLAEDISPNRLERSKLAIIDLLQEVAGDRVGLIAFSGSAFLQCPLTLDYQAFRQTLAAIGPGTIPVGGTDVSAAIDEAEAYFEQTDNERILILITDGEDLEASGIQRAREAAANGTRILTVGVGSTEGELIPVRSPGGQVDYLRDSSGNPVSTALDEATLKRIAEVSNGLYAPLGATGTGLEVVYRFSADEMPAEARQESLQRIPIERFQWVLVLAVILLIIESLLTTRIRQGSPGRLSLLLMTGLVLFGGLSPQAAVAGLASEAAKAYEEGRFEESVSLYSEALIEKPEDPRLLYNRGVSAYRAGDFTSAIGNFEKTLPSADPELQAKAFHNSGNSRVAYGFSTLDEIPSNTLDQWHAARIDYENALALDSGRSDSRQNLDQVTAAIESHTYTLSTQVDPPNAGKVSPGGMAFHRMPLEISAQAEEGWVFSEWIGEGVENPRQAKTQVLMETDTTVTAIFAKTWRLTVASENPEMGTAGKSGTYREDEPVTIKAEPEDYFAFSGWESDDLQLEDPSLAELEINLTQDSSVVATFVPAFKLDVTIDPEIGGKAGPSGFFEEYSVVPLQAEPREGFEWIGWEGDAKDPESLQTSVALISDKNLTARMKRIWNLVLIPQPEEGGTVNGGGNHPVGTTVEISATPAEGHTFIGWEGPGIDDPSSPATKVTVESREHTLVARFEAEDQDQDQNQDQDQDQNQQDQQDQQDQQEQEQDQEQEEEAPQEQEPQQDEEASPEDENERTPEDEEAGSPESEGQEAQPIEMTRDEARQMLNALSENERFLPASEISQEKQDSKTSSGRDW